VVVRAWQGAEPATTENERTRARFRWLRVVVKVWQGAEPTTTKNEQTRARFRSLWVVVGGSEGVARGWVRAWQGGEVALRLW